MPLLSRLRSPAIPAFLTLVFAVVAITLTLRAQPPLAPVPEAPSERPVIKGVRRHGVAEPLPKPPNTFRLASYNVENLFDDQDDPALSGEYEDKDMTKSEAACKAVAAAIRAIDADVLALEEIESQAALRQFRDKHLAGLGYDHLLSLDAGDERGIEQAVLSRFPLKDPKQWIREPLGGSHPAKFGREPNRLSGKPITFHRSPLRVTVEVPAAPGAPGPYELTLFVVHQKSGGPGGYWREREAAKTIELVGDFTKTHPGANVVILGDFNAVPADPAMKLYADAGLIDLMSDKPERDPSFITHSSGRVLDHMLFTADAWKEVRGDSRFVLGTITRPEGVDWRTTPNPDGWASDHYPVVVDITPADQP